MRRSEDPKKAAVERQKRYREARRLVSIDLASATAATLRQLRERTAMNTDALVAAALALFADQLDKSVPRARPRPPKVPPQTPTAPSMSARSTGAESIPKSSPGDEFQPANIPPTDPARLAQRADSAPAAQPAGAALHRARASQPSGKRREKQGTTSQIQPPNSSLDLFGNPSPLPHRRKR